MGTPFHDGGNFDQLPSKISISELHPIQQLPCFGACLFPGQPPSSCDFPAGCWIFTCQECPGVHLAASPHHIRDNPADHRRHPFECFKLFATDPFRYGIRPFSIFLHGYIVRLEYLLRLAIELGRAHAAHSQRSWRDFIGCALVPIGFSSSMR